VTAATPGQDSCGCPETDGKIYHQRGTCTDPVAARLDWYADGPAPAAAATPGQAGPVPGPRDLLAEALWRHRDALGNDMHGILDAADAYAAAQEPHAAPGPAGCECGHAQTGHAFSDDVCAVPDCPCPGYRRTPRAAPELARLRAELHEEQGYRSELTNDILLNAPESLDGDEAADVIAVRYVRHLEAEIAEQPPELAEVRRAVIIDMLAAFSPSGSGCTARVGMVQIAKWRTRAGLTS
jgi:hypothetical protein